MQVSTFTKHVVFLFSSIGNTFLFFYAILKMKHLNIAYKNIRKIYKKQIFFVKKIKI